MLVAAASLAVLGVCAFKEFDVLIGRLVCFHGGREGASQQEHFSAELYVISTHAYLYRGRATFINTFWTAL